jgi:glucose/arabinose dehydrogenase
VENARQHTLVTPAGVRVTRCATGLPIARFMALGPVGVLVAADGSRLISDDDAGVIYRLAPLGR